MDMAGGTIWIWGAWIRIFATSRRCCSTTTIVVVVVDRNLLKDRLRDDESIDAEPNPVQFPNRAEVVRT